MLYLVQRTDCDRFGIAADIDNAYALAFEQARLHGVEVLCYGTQITPQGVELGSAITMDL